MSLLSSYFSNKTEPYFNTEGAFLSLSKGKNLLDNSPVFDLWVFENGEIIYNGLENVDKIGMYKTNILLDVIDDIKEFILSINPNDIGQVKGIDNPLTILKLNNKKIVYQPVRIKGNLLNLNNLLESMVENIQKDINL